MATFKGFESWGALLGYLQYRHEVYYKPPMDFQPSLVVVSRKYKNGKLGIRATGLSFTADVGHLDRFLRRVDEYAPQSIDDEETTREPSQTMSDLVFGDES